MTALRTLGDVLAAAVFLAGLAWPLAEIALHAAR